MHSGHRSSGVTHEASAGTKIRSNETVLLMPMRVRCSIAGGGPAGVMRGFLLARTGIDIVALEKHADFLRDFRGDATHPSTLELMHVLTGYVVSA